MPTSEKEIDCSDRMQRGSRDTERGPTAVARPTHRVVQSQLPSAVGRQETGRTLERGASRFHAVGRTRNGFLQIWKPRIADAIRMPTSQKEIDCSNGENLD